MRLVFCGTPAHAVPSLEALAAKRPSWEIALVLSQPDRGRGRGRRVLPSPVKEAAVRLGLAVETPEKLTTAEMKARLAALRPDVVAVVAYGKIFRPWLLELPRFGCVNVHFSLLPRHRGVAPVARAILAGDVETGVTTMGMDPGVDTGPVYLQRRAAIAPRETCGALTPRLGALGAPLLVETIERVAAGTLAPAPQDETLATTAPALTKEDGRVDWGRPAEEIARRVRALEPWPGAFTTLRGEPFKIGRARAAPGEAPPGAFVVVEGKPAIGTGEGILLLEEVQAAGRNRVDGAAWMRGAHPREGERFGEDA